MRDPRIVLGHHSEEKVQFAKQARREPTPTEEKLWNHLRAGRFESMHFRRQQVIAGFIVDFYCHASKLIIEVDGAIHEYQTEYDAERTTILNAYGLHVLRVAASEVEGDIKGVLSKIRQTALANTSQRAQSIIEEPHEY